MRDLVACALALAIAATACRKAPEADPKKVVTVATNIIRNVPVPGAVRNCTPNELYGNATMTMRTVYTLAEQEIPDVAGMAQWINPKELDSPAAIILADEASSEQQRRQAAAELLAAKTFLVYRIDHIAAPLALGIKETKRGSVGARALRYSRTGDLICLIVFDWLNDDDVAREGFAKLGATTVPADVIKRQREDLVEHYLKKVQSLAIPPPK